MLMIDLNTNAVIAETNDPAYVPLPGYVTTESPDDFYFEQAGEWTWSGTVLVRDLALVLARLKAAKLADLAAYRYQKETAGIILNNAVIKTDLEAQAKINGAWSYTQMNPDVLIDWKADSGWIQIDAATIAAIALSVASHVQACFSTERIHAEAIAGLATAEAVQAYDVTTGWPP